LDKNYPAEDVYGGRKWKREKTYSIEPKNLNLVEYKKVLLKKLKDTLEITGFASLKKNFLKEVRAGTI
jgi:hypothetical protein